MSFFFPVKDLHPVFRVREFFDLSGDKSRLRLLRGIIRLLLVHAVKQRIPGI